MKHVWVLGFRDLRYPKPEPFKIGLLGSGENIALFSKHCSPFFKVSQTEPATIKEPENMPKTEQEAN